MWIVFPLGFAIALLQADLFAGQAFRRLLSELASRPTPEGWHAIVADALDDPSLRLGYWDPAAGHFRDADGGELARTPEGVRPAVDGGPARRPPGRRARHRRRSRRESGARRRRGLGDAARRRDRPARGRAARLAGARARRRRRRAAPDRARPPRHRSAAAPRPPRASQPRRRAAAAGRAADRRAARARARRGARRAAEHRARHLSAGARAARARRRAALGGAERGDSDQRHGRGPAPAFLGDRAGRLLLLPGGAAERGQARRSGGLRQRLALRR